MTSTIDRSFTGTLDIGEQAVPATIRFNGDGVSLLVGGDAVGTWDRNEIDIVPGGTFFEICAEGDSIRFDPDDVEGFEGFLSGSEPVVTDPPGGHEPTPPDTTGVGFTPPPLPSSLDHEDSFGSDSPPEPALEGLPSQRSLFSEDAEDGPPSDLSPAFSAEEDDPEPAISWDHVPDELYAAGLTGDAAASSPPPFRSPLGPASEVTAAPPQPGDAATVDEGDGADATVTESPVEPEAQEPPAWEVPAPGIPVQPVTSPAPVTEDPGSTADAGALEGHSDLNEAALDEADLDPAASTTETARSTLSGRSTPVVDAEPDLFPDPDSKVDADSPDPNPEMAAGSPDADAATAANAGAGRGAAIAGFARSMVEAFRDRSTTEKSEATETADEREDGDITPEPIDDRENLRQWGLVVAGGLVLLALIAMVTWGLTSMLGGDEPLQAVETTPTTAATTVATVAASTSTTTPPLTTISPENQAAAAGFVESWNRLATQYAYHLSISADSLPISVAPAPTVHLTYDESGVLALKMAPKGTGSDRDLLLAMGLAVAWGDPSLSPEARKEVLGAMGVDVDDPQLQEMGGSLSRNGVSYEASVSDGLIQFQVAPEA